MKKDVLKLRRICRLNCYCKTCPIKLAFNDLDATTICNIANLRFETIDKIEKILVEADANEH